MQTALLVGQVVFGLYFIKSGLAHLLGYKGMVGYAQFKKVPMAPVAVPVTGVMMIAGGLGVVLGMYTTVALSLIVLFLVPTAFIMHNFWTETDASAKMNSRINFEKNLALAAAALMLLSLPLPWAISLM